MGARVTTDERTRGRTTTHKRTTDNRRRTTDNGQKSDADPDPAHARHPGRLLPGPPPRADGLGAGRVAGGPGLGAAIEPDRAAGRHRPALVGGRRPGADRGDGRLVSPPGRALPPRRVRE